MQETNTPTHLQDIYDDEKTVFLFSDDTTILQAEQNLEDKLVVTIFDANRLPSTVALSSFQKDEISFGRNENYDIPLQSRIVSREQHGRIILKNGKWYIEDLNSRNGLVYNNTNIKLKQINDGDLIRIDDSMETIADGVLFVFSSRKPGNQ